MHHCISHFLISISWIPRLPLLCLGATGTRSKRMENISVPMKSSSFGKTLMDVPLRRIMWLNATLAIPAWSKLYTKGSQNLKCNPPKVLAETVLRHSHIQYILRPSPCQGKKLKDLLLREGSFVEVEAKLRKWKSSKKEANKEGGWVTKSFLKDFRKWNKNLVCM